MSKSCQKITVNPCNSEEVEQLCRLKENVCSNPLYFGILSKRMINNGLRLQITSPVPFSTIRKTSFWAKTIIRHLITSNQLSKT